jgi:acyl-coenzyme A synthetase/AMP-(fatty) acid ligase
VAFTSRTTLIGALALGATAVLGVPAAAVPAVATLAQKTPVLVSITAPAEVERGQQATFGVTVRDMNSSVPVGGTLVVLLRRADGEGDWAEADRALTDPAGRVILTAAVKPPSTDFKARVPATDTHRRGASARVTVIVN